MSAAANIPEGFESQRKGGALVFQNAKLWQSVNESGRMVHGEYLGLTEPGMYGQDFKFKALSDGISVDKEGNVTNYKAGTTVIINKSGSLKKQLESAKIGDIVIVDYDGAEKMRKGQFKGRLAYNFTVYVKTMGGTESVVEAENAQTTTISADTKSKLSGLAAKKA